MGTKRDEITVENSLMIVRTKLENINILHIQNRRFMYNVQSGILILGSERYGKSILSSHAEEFHSSMVGGCFDEYLRGWIGTGSNYPNGILHFSPAISQKLFDKGVDMLQMFASLNGVNYNTIIRGFYNTSEEKIGNLLPLSFKQS